LRWNVFQFGEKEIDALPVRGVGARIPR
jgi:hypothetical protein